MPVVGKTKIFMISKSLYRKTEFTSPYQIL